MKKFTTLIMTGLTVLLASCSTTYPSYSSYDDVYYSPNKETTPSVTVRPAAANEQVAAPDYSTTIPAEPSYQGNDQTQYQGENTYADDPNSQAYSPDYQANTYHSPDGDVYITNNNYGGDFQYNDYYDYAYSSRIRRFGRPHFNDYYHDYYTNYYWYNYDPWYYGTSIYLGYNFWYPSYYYYGRPRFHVGIGWGWPSYGWYSPYSYYYGWGWPSYSMGYWHGYYDGYYGGYYGSYYYNSYDYNAYYGPRTPRTSTSGTNTSGREPRTLGERYELAMASQGVNTGLSTRMARIGEPAKRATTETRPQNNTGVNRDMQGRAEASTETQRSVTTRSTESSAPATRIIGAEDRRNEKPTVRESSEGQGTTTRQAIQTRPSTTPNESSREGTTPERTIQSRPDQSAQPGSQTKPAEKDRSSTPADRYSNTSKYNYDRYTPDTKTPENYQRPDPAVYQRYQKPKVYTAPANTRPQSGQEYTSPRAKDPASYTRPGGSETPARQSAPARPQDRIQPNRPTQTPTQQGSRQYTPPSRPATREVTTPNQRSNPTYSPPSKPANRSTQPSGRSSGTYTPPTRSSSPTNYSPPSRPSSRSSSSGSYSPPSRSSSSSSSSYSAPTRSSSSSSGSSSRSSSSSSSSSRSSDSGRGRR